MDRVALGATCITLARSALLMSSLHSLQPACVTVRGRQCPSPPSSSSIANKIGEAWDGTRRWTWSHNYEDPYCFPRASLHCSLIILERVGKEPWKSLRKCLMLARRIDPCFPRSWFPMHTDMTGQHLLLFPGQNTCAVLPQWPGRRQDFTAPPEGGTPLALIALRSAGGRLHQLTKSSVVWFSLTSSETSLRCLNYRQKISNIKRNLSGCDHFPPCFVAFTVFLLSSHPVKFCIPKAHLAIPLHITCNLAVRLF